MMNGSSNLPSSDRSRRSPSRRLESREALGPVAHYLRDGSGLREAISRSHIRIITLWTSYRG